MRLYTAVLFFIIGLSFAEAQITNNPFEIQSRMDSMYKAPNSSESSSSNIFDVEREGSDASDVIGGTNPLATPSDTLPPTEESTIVPAVGEEDQVGSESENEQAETALSDNPFDVSHIPIRKSKLKNEANAFTNKKQKEEKIPSGSNSFLFWLNLFTAFLLAIVINTQSGVLSKIAKSITNENVLKLNHREENGGLNGHYILLYVCYFINAAIFLYLILYNYFDQQGWLVFLSCILAIIGIYITKHLLISGLGRIFPIQKNTSLYGFTIQSFNLFIGMLLIPLNLIIAFGPEKIAAAMIIAGLVVLSILLLIRIFRGFLIASSYVQSNLFHFLLYLCAFEILPIILFLKILGKMNFS